MISLFDVSVSNCARALPLSRAARSLRTPMGRPMLKYWKPEPATESGS